MKESSKVNAASTDGETATSIYLCVGSVRRRDYTRAEVRVPRGRLTFPARRSKAAAWPGGFASSIHL